MRRLINLQPNRVLKVALGIIPFLLILLAYQIGSDIRKAENEQDKLLPSFSEIAAGINRMAFKPSPVIMNFGKTQKAASSGCR